MAYSLLTTYRQSAVVTKFGFEDTCNFNVFLQPKQIYLKPDEFQSKNISYICYSANDNVNGIWVIINGKWSFINSTGSITGTIKRERNYTGLW